MAMKSIILITLLVVVFVAPQANAQTISVRINGTVFCSLNGSIVANATIPTHPFPNATVVLRVMGIPILPPATTNSHGQFTINFDQSLLTSTGNLLSLNTDVVVTTPHPACNSTLPANTFLQSVPPLIQLVKNTTVIELGVRAFQPIKI